MKIQNPAMAGQALTLRFARDDNGNPVTATGDAKGVFDLPQKDAEFLVSTPGWGPLRAASLVQEAAPAPAPAPTPAPAPAAAETAPAPAAEAEEEVGPDLNALDKDQLLEVAKKYGIEVKKAWGEDKLRQVLDKALYGDQE